MWNSGGKNVWKRLGEGLTGKKIKPDWASEATRAMAGPAAGEALGWIRGLQPRLSDIGEEIYGRAKGMDLGEAGEEALFKQEARRWREQMLPSLAARGVLTSGLGIGAEKEGIEELATKFTGRSFERQVQREQLVQQAAQGLAVLKSLPIEMQTKILAAILGQTAGTVTQGKGWIELMSGLMGGMGGGTGMAAMGLGGGGVPPVV